MVRLPIELSWRGVNVLLLATTTVLFACEGHFTAFTPLQLRELGLNDVDAWEINEAFAAQVIACERAWEDADYCRQDLGLDHPMGKLDEAKLNVDGGAIALGHPLGATGAMILGTVLDELERTNKSTALVTLCIGGGMGTATIIERV